MSISSNDQSNRLTVKQKLFIAEYIANGFNGAAAARKVYNAKNNNVASAIAGENLRKENIKQALAFELERLTPSTARKLSPEWIISKLISMAENARGDNNKLKALELLGETKHIKLFEKRSVVENINSVKATEADLDAEYRELINRRKGAGKLENYKAAYKELAGFAEIESSAESQSELNKLSEGVSRIESEDQAAAQQAGESIQVYVDKSQHSLPSPNQEHKEG